MGLDTRLPTDARARRWLFLASRVRSFKSSGPTTEGSPSPSATNTATRTGRSTAWARELPGSSRQSKLAITQKSYVKAFYCLSLNAPFTSPVFGFDLKNPILSLWGAFGKKVHFDETNQHKYKALSDKTRQGLQVANVVKQTRMGKKWRQCFW